MDGHSHRLLFSHLRQAQAPLVLVAASLISAAATIADANQWVGATAAVAAIASGAIVIRSQVFVPVRIRTATGACVRVMAELFGSAVQIAPGIWVTAEHVVRVRDAASAPSTIRLWLAGGVAEARLVWSSAAKDLALLHCDTAHPWVAGVSPEADLDEGDAVRIVAWTHSQYEGDRPALRVSQEYVVLAVTDDGGLMLSGPPPFAGMSGGTAIAHATGRVVGVAVEAIPPEDRGDDRYYLPSVVPGVIIKSLAPIPKDRLSKR